MKFQSINLHAAINKLSYGLASVNILDALMSKGIKVSLFPIGQMEVDERHIAVVKQALENAKFFEYTAPCIKIFHQNHMGEHIGKGPLIGFPIFELNQFTSNEKHNLAYPDHLFVCSEWAKSVVGSNFLSKVHVPEWDSVWDNTHVIPLGVDQSVFYPTEITDGDTVFLNISKLEKRKGIDILVKAFQEEFCHGENVKLLLCCDNPFLNKDQVEQWMKLIGGYSNVIFVPRQEESKDIANLINMSDCGVYPSKAEGWNMPALETLACGRHLIITDYSAHTQFCNSLNSKLIKIEKMELAYDDIWPVFHGQGAWAQIGDSQVRDLKSYMRHIHTLKQSGELNINGYGVQTASEFSWDNTAQKIIETLSVLQ